MARVLHIESDPSVRSMVRELLISAGHEVLEAVDGIDGVGKALASAPALILVEVVLPGLDGYEVTLRLRGEGGLKNVPILALTNSEDRERCLAVGCNGHLRKPIDPRTFVRQVSVYFRGHREKMDSTLEESQSIILKEGGRIVAHLERTVAELRSANERLRDAERRRTEFYRNISHELATPLTPIVGYLRMLKDAELGPVSAQQARALQAMDDCTNRLRTTLSNLVDVTGLEMGTMQLSLRPYELVSVVRQAMAQASTALAATGQRLFEELPKVQVPAVGDPERIVKAIVHLLDNAAKFGARGGEAGIALRVSDTHAEVLVADSGYGVPFAAQAGLFEAFYQADGSVTRAHGGVGVGLAIVKKIAEGHGGDASLIKPPFVIANQAFSGGIFSFRILRKPK